MAPLVPVFLLSFHTKCCQNGAMETKKHTCFIVVAAVVNFVSGMKGKAKW